MSSVWVPPGKQQFLDPLTQEPLVGGLVYFYIPATFTPKDTWQDQAQMSLNTNPIVLDAAGECIIWGDGLYRQILKRADSTQIWDQETGFDADLQFPLNVNILVDSTAVDGGVFGENIRVINPTDHSGYEVRKASLIRSGRVLNGVNDIADALIAVWDDIGNGIAWDRWDVQISPLAVGSGYPGAPTEAQNFYMVVREVNPENRHADPGGWQPEARLFVNGVAGEQMVAETQDFTNLLGPVRIGYNIAFGYTVGPSPFCANIGGVGNRHARFYNGWLVSPNGIAPGGYGFYGTGYKAFLTAAAVSVGGSGYAVGDLLELNTTLSQILNENSVLKVLTVDGSGAVLTVEIYEAGAYSQSFASPIGVTGGGGAGATFTYTLSSTAEAPAAWGGIGGTWNYGIDLCTTGSSVLYATILTAFLRVPNNTVAITGRNAANSANVDALKINSSDQWELVGKAITTPATWTPTLSADSGTFTTISVTDARYSVINGWCHFSLNVHLTTKGSAAGALRFTPPVPASARSYACAGAEATTGNSLSCLAASGGANPVRCALYNGSDPLADARFYTISGSYEVA